MNNSKNKKFNTSKLAYLGLLIALQIIFSRFISINTPIVKIGFGFLPLAVMGIMYGPLTAGICAVVADIIGLMLFPTGAYFPGFTLTEFLTGYAYGYFLYNKPVTLNRILASSVVVCILLNLLLNTYWLTIILGKGYLALLPTRAIKSLAMIPVQAITISLAYEKFILKFTNLIKV
ncbi:MAG: folate family ECF transporter S component [Romboutsia sp.]|uniref:folate family ECF transporter S component n=1 Tax=Romboutsia sp. TaxID=1965302 RepID=UPI003F3A1D12